MTSYPAPVTIRLATDADFDAIYSIWLDGLGNSFDAVQADMDQLQACFASNFRQRQGIFNFWVATDQDNNVLGWQSLIRASHNPIREHRCAESSTYIARSTRARGLGKYLLDHVLQEAEKSPLEYVVAYVSLANEAARKITRETGWILVGDMPPARKADDQFRKSFLVRPV